MFKGKKKSNNKKKIKLQGQTLFHTLFLYICVQNKVK